MTEKARLGWVIVYVPDVLAAIEFYEKTFGLERAFVGEDAGFGELDTGQTKLAFAAETGVESNFEFGFRRPGDQPFNIEVALVFDDPEAAFARALENGASSIAEPKTKPWGQVVAYVRDPFGTLLELASPTD
jgi:lactoylglutathione lyase